MSIELRWATAESITGDLEQAREAIEDCGARAPTGIDAGEVTPMLTEMLARIAETAAEVSAGLLGAVDNVRSAVAALESADVASQQAFRPQAWW